MDEPPVAIALFETLMAAIEDDEEAREGLALAYRSMHPEERRCLIETIALDGERGGRSRAEPLLTLLSVEEDPERAAEIVAILTDEDRSIPAAEAAFVYGHPQRGGVVLVRPRFGDFVSVLHLMTSDGALASSSEELARRSELAEVQTRLGVPEDVTPVSPELGIDRMAETIWRALRGGGELPADLRRHADIFTARFPA